MYCLRPGKTSSPRSLLAMWRARHERTREQWLEDRRVREENDVPLDDREPWHDRAGALLTELADAVEGGRVADARTAAARMTVALEPPPDEPGDFEAGALADDTVTVTLRAVSHAQVVDHLQRLRAAVQEGEDTTAEMAEFVRLAVAEVDGLEDESGTYSVDASSEAGPETLRAAGILAVVYLCARDFQNLDPAEKKTFGLSRPTPPREPSAKRSAEPVPSSSVDSADATGAPPTGEGPNTNTTPVLAASSSETPGSSTQSSSTPLPGPGSSGWAASG